MLKKVLLAVFVSLVLGLGSVYLVLGPGLRWFSASKVVQLGCWKYLPHTGSTKADLYSGVYIAITSLFALDQSESIYFLADTDADGNPLDPEKSYAITGGNPEVRWWSVTAYRNNHLIANDAGVYSFSKTSVAADSSGRWKVIASSKVDGAPILPLGNQKGSIDLILRCYHPGPGFRKALASGTLELPLIQPIAKP